MGLPRYPSHRSSVPCPLPRRIRQVRVSIASLPARPSPLFRRVGIRTFTFEACSDFTHVTARWIAQPPKAAFVTGLRPRQLPSDVARQLPDQSTTLWVEPTSTGETRHRGALNKAGSIGWCVAPMHPSIIDAAVFWRQPKIYQFSITSWFNVKHCFPATCMSWIKSCSE